jgi:hypothetical protein
MQKFSLFEVIEFLRANPKKIFDYTNPRCNEKVGCLMAEFFKSKGFAGVQYGVSASGRYLYDGSEPLCEVENLFPISQIHTDPETNSGIYVSGELILKNIERFQG